VQRAGVCYPVLDRGRRWLERHGAEGVRERLLVPARAIPGCLACRRNRCGLLVQWLLLLPEHESQGRVLTWCVQEGLWALLSHRYQTGVHGNVPLHGLTYVGHGEVALPSLLVDPVEATVVLPELPPRSSPLLLFLSPLPPPLSPVRRLLFLFRLLLLLGCQDDAEGCGLGARGTVLV
jgi:hypothetical protein